MKKRVLLFTLTVLFCFQLQAQTTATLAPGGGGPHQVTATDQCLKAEDRSLIQSKLQENIARLQAEGILPTAPAESIVNFGWPIRMADFLDYNNADATSNYVDQNFSSGLLDYACGNRTYDGHRGVDLITWPFPWHLYDNDLVEVVAGEAGTIIDKDDGFDDDHCACFGMWNAVYLQHADGSVAWYGHLKRNSLTQKGIGQSVAKGEYLGIVASSGCSTAPHLHLEVYDNQNNLIDPFVGNCNSLNNQSWWVGQQAYREPKINAALTHGAVPQHGCPGISEAPFFKNTFAPGETVYFAGYYRDQIANQPSNYRILLPNNTVWQNWTHSSPQTYFASWWWWTWQLPLNGPYGVWRFEIEYDGQTVSHPFNYGITTSTENLLLAKQVEVFPNPTTKSVHLIYETEEAMEVQLISSAGQTIGPVLSRPQAIDLSTLSDGLYYLQLKTAKAISTKKVVKISE